MIFLKLSEKRFSNFQWMFFMPKIWALPKSWALEKKDGNGFSAKKAVQWWESQKAEVLFHSVTFDLIEEGIAADPQLLGS